MNIQTKVTILFITLTSAVILLLSGFIFLFTYHYAFEDFYQRLETRARIAQSIHFNKDKDSTGVMHQLRQQYLEKLPSEEEYYLKLTPEMKIVPPYPEKLPRELIEQILSDGEARYRQGNRFFAGNLYPASSPTTMVVVSAADPYGLKELNRLRNALIICFLVSILVVYLVGKVFSYQTFKPIRELIANVQRISADNLHLRLQTGTGNDEISMLRQTFNDMLTRLETAFETQNNFVSNASHELRTPLTIIKGEAELALRQPGLSKAHQHSIEVILQESEKLTYMLAGLLELAQSGFDGKKQYWEPVRTDELIWLVKQTIDQLYPGNQVRIHFDKLPEEEHQLTVYGNIDLLKLAVSNIVMNACKYSHNQPVIISLYSNNDQVIIGVKDRGIGIPEKEVRYVFEPFFRASNTTSFQGYGIGLPLSMNIIRLHKGNITIDSKVAEGTHISIILPVAGSQPLNLEKTIQDMPAYN
jgi:signal transduction histidine kinase